MSYPSIVRNIDATGLTSQCAAQEILTPIRDAKYRITLNIAAVSPGADLINLIVSFTNADLGIVQEVGVGVDSEAVGQNQEIISIIAKEGFPIQWKTTFNNPIITPEYNIHITVEEM